MNRTPHRALPPADVAAAWAWHSWHPRWLPGRVATFLRSRALARFAQPGVCGIDADKRMLLRLDDAIQCTIAHNGEWEGLIFDCVAKFVRPGDVVLDVGGHVGYSALRFADCVGPDGKVYVFEPFAGNADQIVENLRLNGFESRVEVVRAAVSDRAGVVAFATRTNGNFGMGAIDPNCTSAARQVPTVALDDWLDAKNIDRIALAKIDIEGAEALALAGMERGLRAGRYRTILLELHPAELPHFGSSIAQVLDTLAGCGYRLLPWSEEGRFEEMPFPADGLYLLATRGET